MTPHCQHCGSPLHTEPRQQTLWLDHQGRAWCPEATSTHSVSPYYDELLQARLV